MNELIELAKQKFGDAPTESKLSKISPLLATAERAVSASFARHNVDEHTVNALDSDVKSALRELRAAINEFFGTLNLSLDETVNEILEAKYPSLPEKKESTGLMSEARRKELGLGPKPKP